MKRYRNKLMCAIVAFVGLGATAATSQAGSFVSGFNGNVDMTGGSTAVVSFAVIDTGAQGAAAYLKSLGTVSTLAGAASGRYVYLYEVVNTSTSKQGALSLTADFSQYTSAGQIKTTVFQNTNGGANKPNYPVVYYPPVLPTDPNPKDGFVLTNQTASKGSFVIGNSGTAATGIDATAGSGSITFDFGGPQPSKYTLLSHGNSDLLFLTSNLAPTSANGSVFAGGGSANGNLPVAAPEPQTFALMSAGLIGLGGWTGWRRRFRKLS